MELVLTESGDFRDISHLYHFIELLFVGLVKLDQVGKSPGDVTKVNIPHWPQESWKGKGHPHNEWILRKICQTSQYSLTHAHQVSLGTCMEMFVINDLLGWETMCSLRCQLQIISVTGYSRV